jgi:hypothetical protein
MEWCGARPVGVIREGFRCDFGGGSRLLNLLQFPNFRIVASSHLAVVFRIRPVSCGPTRHIDSCTVIRTETKIKPAFSPFVSDVGVTSSGPRLVLGPTVTLQSPSMFRLIERD